MKVIAADGALTKSGGCESCPDAGAHSVTRLTGDGYAEFVPGASRVIAGLSTDLSASTASSTIDFAFSFWPSGAWEVRERGVYRKDGSSAAGDRFRVGVESGMVVYRRNGAIVYTSTVAPSYPLALDVTINSLNGSISGATVVIGSTDPVDPPPPPPPPPEPTGTPVLTSVGPYHAAVDRFPYAKPALPVMGAAGSTAVDPVFGSTITRVTDGSIRPDSLNRSYKTPSSPHQNAWSATGSRFYVAGGGGAVLPYTFDATTGQAQRIDASTSGSGGLVLKFYIEPQFSYVNDSIIYGSVSGGSLRTIDQYDFTTSAYTRLLDLDALVPGLAGTYIGGIASSAGPTERVIAMFGGTRQDLHHYAIVFAAGNPQNRLILDTTASTLNGAPTSVPLNFLLHHVMIDRSGRYVMLYPTSADQTGPRQAPQSVAWDTQANVFTEMPVSALPYGHDAFGYGVSVNKDCCRATSWDAGQWQFRSLASPLMSRDLITTILTPKEIYLSDHTTWNNARPDNSAPVISGTYRHSGNTAPWRAWDDEIIAMQTDAPGANPVVWRFAHHRSDVRNDLDATRTSFWYMPRPNVSPDGRWVLFTSNWEKTLGTDPFAEVGGAARQDVFLVALKSSTPPPPPVVPVTITTTSLPSSRATLAYSAVLQASGGTGAYTWSIASGALPEGLTLDQGTGEISGTPLSAGTAAVTIAAADTTNAANSASAAFTIAIASAPVQVTTGSLPTGRAAVSYSAPLEASGGSGSTTWSVTAGALPGGLAIDPSTGLISGTPAAAGHADFTVTVTDAGDSTNTAAAAFTIDIAAPPVAITPATLPGGRATIAYSAALQATGGSGSTTWSVTAGALPGGLAIDSSTGLISGTPAAAGHADFTVTVTDAGESTNTAAAAFTIDIAAPPVAITPATLRGGRATIAYSAALQATGGGGTYAWSISAGALPGGLALDNSTGAIAGTPSTAGTFAFTVQAADALDLENAASAAHSIVVATAPVAILTGSVPGGRVTLEYGAALAASGGDGSFTWAIAAGSLPPGLSLGTASGVITGTPAAAGTFAFSVTATDASDATNTATASYSIVIGARPVVLLTASLASGREKNSYSAVLQASGGGGPIGWSVTGGALPPGLTLNTTTGAITGTPTAAGTYGLTLTAADASDAANVATGAYTIAIGAAVKITSPRTIPAAGKGQFYTYTLLAANVQGTVKWDLAGGSIPPGMSLDPATGVISGTCVKPGTWHFNARVKDATTSDALTLTLKVQ